MVEQASLAHVGVSGHRLEHQAGGPVLEQAGLRRVEDPVARSAGAHDHELYRPDGTADKNSGPNRGEPPTHISGTQESAQVSAVPADQMAAEGETKMIELILLAGSLTLLAIGLRNRSQRRRRRTIAGLLSGRRPCAVRTR